MIREIEIEAMVPMPSKILDENETNLHRETAKTLLNGLAAIKSTQRYGYFLAVTDMKHNGQVEAREDPYHVFIPVSIRCRSFMPVRGEIMLGAVRVVGPTGVFLSCGPMKFVYLAGRKMPDFDFVEGKTGKMFMREDKSKIAKGVVVRFVIFAARWTREHRERRGDHFNVLASIDGHGLGPVSLAGTEELEF